MVLSDTNSTKKTREIFLKTDVILNLNKKIPFKKTGDYRQLSLFVYYGMVHTSAVTKVWKTAWPKGMHTSGITELCKNQITLEKSPTVCGTN